MENRNREILGIMPENLRCLMKKALGELWGGLEEIRLRVNKPLIVGTAGGNFAILKDGNISPALGGAYIVSESDIKRVFCSICENSVYAHEAEIRQGYITVRGGHRVGFSGKAVIRDGKIDTLKEINGINIRIAKEKIGCGSEYLKDITYNGRIINTLVISSPGCGKTTLLRDLTRLISNSGIKVSVVDERGEIGACYGSVPQNDIGFQTDIIEDAPKKEAIPLMLRSMSPQLIICDEIASESDMLSIKKCFGSGVGVIASAHAGSVEEVKSNPLIRCLLGGNGFNKIILLKRNNESISKRISGEVFEVKF
ncbi:MAG: stage III sporulation protein AA [Ruminococcaceae bacterium]|nr:stage III sporulation protein AA [Oscillospiraceae bacterium]